MSKKCDHEFKRVTLKGGGTSQWMGPVARILELAESVLSVRCDDCGVQLSLGESDEAPVAIEIRAVAMANDWLVDQELRGYAPADWTSWAEHEHPIGEMTERESAGWLARELVTHGDRETRDATAWAWSKFHPIAGQYELSQHVAILEDALDGGPDHESGRDAALSDAFFEENPEYLDSTDTDAPTRLQNLASTTPLLAILTAGVERYDIDDPYSVNPLSGVTNAQIDEISAEYLKESLQPDDLDPPTDPATKFGEIAAQVVVPVDPFTCPVTPGDFNGPHGEVEDTIREQTRHDVAASVARHSEIDTGGES